MYLFTYFAHFYCNYGIFFFFEGLWNTFLIMNIIKHRFHNKMKDDILGNFLILYIKREIGVKFNS